MRRVLGQCAGKVQYSVCWWQCFSGLGHLGIEALGGFVEPTQDDKYANSNAEDHSR